MTRCRGTDDAAVRRDHFTRAALPLLDRLYAAAVALTGSRADAEGVVEQTYLTAFAAFPPPGPPAQLDRWLYSIFAETLLPAAHSRPQEYAGEVRDRRCTVRQALLALPAPSRFAVYLADVEGYSRAEIAEILTVPAAAVTGWLSDGHRELRRRLADAAPARWAGGHDQD